MQVHTHSLILQVSKTWLRCIAKGSIEVDQSSRPCFCIRACARTRIMLSQVDGLEQRQEQVGKTKDLDRVL